MQLWIEMTSFENEDHFVAFREDGFGREFCYILTTDFPYNVLATLKLASFLY